MKVGIITFHNAHNCGAALQVYAMQTLLSRYGHDCEVINYRVSRIDRSYEVCSNKRKQRFEDFMSTKLKLSRRFNSLNELQQFDHPYDVILSGSDQIWNSSILGGLNSAYFCNFGRKDAKRIIYGASLGTSLLNSTDEFLLRYYLRYPDSISVREASALPLLRPLTDKKIETVLDPTLLLSSEDYRPLIASSPLHDPYIYLHYVHHTGENPALDRAARELSVLTGLPILKNRAFSRFEHELSSCQDNGPEEFLGTLDHASYVVTDSFHATVFSILFNKKFLTVAPVKRPERLIELLDLLKLSSHLFGDQFNMEQFLTSEYSEVSTVSFLSGLRKASTDYLESAFLAAPSSGNLPFCYGCGACLKKGTGMKRCSDGFLYPEQLSDKMSCNGYTDKNLCILSAPPKGGYTKGIFFLLSCI